jgi:hypothetical protein
MATRLTVLTVLVIAAVLGAVSLASAGDAAPRAVQHEIIDLTSTTVQGTDLDLGDTGFGVGDRFTFADDLARDGAPYGSLGGECTLMRIEPSPLPEGQEPESVTANCVVSAKLPDGQITVQGLVTFSGATAGEPFTLAITGGTGLYAEAQGEVQVTEVSETDSLIQLRLEL